MKIRQPTLKIFIDKVDELEQIVIPKLKKDAERWLGFQKEREDFGNVDQYWANIARGSLEDSLDKFREAISELYDYQNEKGLVDVHATKDTAAS